MQTYETYAEMRQKLGELFQAGQFPEAIELLSWGLDAFPDHYEANIFNLAACQVSAGDPQAGLQSLWLGQARGIWFGPDTFADDFWLTLRELDGFAELQAAYAGQFKQAQALARPVLEVLTPAGYDSDQSYPLFIALHGGGENLDAIRANWISPRLAQEFILAYLQSSQVTGINRFGWPNLDQASTDVREALDEILERYPIDPECILLGGFSDGGRATLALALGQAELHLAGFVVLCPPPPESLTPEWAAAGLRRGLRGVVLSTEMDQRLAEQQAMVQMLSEAGLPLRLVVTPNIGHWYPDDFGAQLDAAIEEILARK